MDEREPAAPRIAGAALDGLIRDLLPEGTTSSAAPSLHSLNNEIRILRVPDRGAEYIARLPNRVTADALGIRREEEAAALRLAADSLLTPTPLVVTAGGAIITPRLSDRGWRGSDWSAPAGKESGVRLVRRLLDASPEEVGPLPTTYERLLRMLAGAMVVGADSTDAAELQARIEAIAEERAADERYARSLAHHDLWANNVIHDGVRPWLVDFEFAGRGDGWFDLATIVHDAGFDDDSTREFLRAVGRRGDRDDVRALRHGTWMFHLFEMLWGTIMSAESVHRMHEGELFDYADHARRMHRKVTRLLREDQTS